MSRTKSVIKNTMWDLGYYLIVIALGFLAPRYIILIYGSEVNGLSSTITQILNIILLLQAGATTAAIFSLYKPITDNDTHEISKKIYSAERFFRKISFIFLGITLVAAVFSSRFIHSGLDSGFIFAAFVILGLKSFLDLYYTSKFRIVFTAYQEKFVISIATLGEQVVYYTLVFLTLYLRIHFLYIYVWFLVGCVVKIIYLKHRYKKDFGELIPRYKGDDIGQIDGRSYAMANEISHSVVGSSVAIILSFMYGLMETSVYSVYALVGQALSLVSASFYSAFGPSFGNLVAARDKVNAKRVFFIFQYIFVMLNTVMLCCMIVLIAPFVKIYTHGATDINYVNLTLACIMGLSGILSAYRVPYNIIVSSCGYFRETWKQPVVCVAISLFFSVIGGKFDYALIVLGPTAFFFINFIYQHFRIKKLAPHLISTRVFIMFGISLMGFVLSSLASHFITMPGEVFSLIKMTVYVAILAVLFVILASLILLRKEMRMSLDYIKVHMFRSRYNA